MPETGAVASIEPRAGPHSADEIEARRRSCDCADLAALESLCISYEPLVE